MDINKDKDVEEINEDEEWKWKKNNEDWIRRKKWTWKLKNYIMDPAFCSMRSYSMVQLAFNLYGENI